MGDAAHVVDALTTGNATAGRLDRSVARRAVARPAEDEDRTADDPTVRDRAAALVWHDETVVDGFLLRAGVRWDLLRRIPRSVRVEWWRTLKLGELPDGYRTCWDGPQVWLDEVEHRLVAQNWQARRLNKWRRFAHLVAEATNRDARPITGPGLTLSALALALGEADKPISTRYVTTIIRWFRDENLLRVVMPGTRAPRLAVPVDELPDEAAERTVREARLEAAHAERRRAMKAWAQAEVDAVREGRTPPPMPDELAVFRDAATVEPDDDRDLLNVAQVYELLVPAAPDVRDAPPQRARGANVADLEHARQRRAQRRRAALGDVPTRPGLAAVRAGEDCTDQDQPGSPAGGFPSICTESSTPTGVTLEGRSSSRTGVVVDERGPSGRSYRGGSGFAGGPNQSRRPLAPAVRAAQRLLAGAEPARVKPGDAVLPRQLCRGVDPRRLASRIGPYVAAGWTDEQLVTAIAHRGGEWSYVPPDVENPTGWIIAALRRWLPAAPPLDADVRRAVEDVERENAEARAGMETRGRRIAGAAHRAAIDECELCDESGMRPLDGGDQVIRCYHSTADRDEVEASRRVDDEGQADELAPRDAALAEIARVLKSDDPARQAVLAEAHRRRQERQAADLANPHRVPRALRLQIQRGQRRS